MHAAANPSRQFDLSWSDGRLRGRGLRYTVSLLLRQSHTPLAVREIVARIEDSGVAIYGRPSKTVSDALRWEIRRGRVVQIDRGRYAAGRVPESTLRFMRNWLIAADAAFAPELRKSLVAQTLQRRDAYVGPGVEPIAARDAPLPLTHDGAIDLDVLDPLAGQD